MTRQYQTVVPYLVSSDALGLVEFIRDAFAAEESERILSDDGRVAHAEVWIGDSCVMVGQAQDGGRTWTSMLYLYVPDCDALFHSAVRVGGSVVSEPKDMYYGDRTAAVDDPFGNQWWVATRKEEIPQD